LKWKPEYNFSLLARDMYLEDSKKGEK